MSDCEEGGERERERERVKVLNKENKRWRVKINDHAIWTDRSEMIIILSSVLTFPIAVYNPLNKFTYPYTQFFTVYDYLYKIQTLF